jgi:hypothetical protein
MSVEPDGPATSWSWFYKENKSPDYWSAIPWRLNANEVFPACHSHSFIFYDSLGAGVE